MCENPDHQLYLSVVSAWEIKIKQQIGKLQLKVTLEDMIQTQQMDNNLIVLPIELSHVYTLKYLPFHHYDSFDRLIIAQASAENMLLVSADTQLSQYDIKIIWEQQSKKVHEVPLFVPSHSNSKGLNQNSQNFITFSIRSRSKSSF